MNLVRSVIHENTYTEVSNMSNNDDATLVTDLNDITTEPTEDELNNIETDLDTELDTESLLDDLESEKEKSKNKTDTSNLDALGMYLQSIGDISLLTQEEEFTLASKIHDDPDDTISKNALVEHNLKLVVSIARHFINSKMPILDLIQNGNLGLMKATERYDVTKGFRFSTYATWWIKQAIIRSIADQSRTIRLPVHIHENINRINAKVRAFTIEKGHEPTNQELADYTGIPLDKINSYRYYSQELISLDATLSSNKDEDSDTDFYNILENTDAESPEDTAMAMNLSDTLNMAMSNLTKKEEDIVRRYFGIQPYDEPATLEDIGAVYNITRERVRQIKKKALLKLKNNDRKYNLSNFIQ